MLPSTDRSVMCSTMKLAQCLNALHPWEWLENMANSFHFK